MGSQAFAYYRRIVEETIDLLLQQISDLMSEDEKGKYEGALKKNDDHSAGYGEN